MEEAAKHIYLGGVTPTGRALEIIITRGENWWWNLTSGRKLITEYLKYLFGEHDFALIYSFYCNEGNCFWQRYRTRILFDMRMRGEASGKTSAAKAGGADGPTNKSPRLISPANIFIILSASRLRDTFLPGMEIPRCPSITRWMRQWLYFPRGRQCLRSGGDVPHCSLRKPQHSFRRGDPSLHRLQVNASSPADSFTIK